MEKMIALLGFLFFMFLVLAAAVEVILETFRGTLEVLGFKWAKGKISLDSALALAAEFAPNNQDLQTRLNAVKSTANQVEKIYNAHGSNIESCIQRVTDLTKPSDNTKQTQTDSPTKVASDITNLALKVKSAIEANESKRIAILRAIAACIGCFLVWITDFHVFRLLAMMPEASDYQGILKGLQSELANVVVGGFAAAAGSSYWHDQLDKVRKLKDISNQFKKPAGQT